jgi:hypothetical protein
MFLFELPSTSSKYFNVIFYNQCVVVLGPGKRLHFFHYPIFEQHRLPKTSETSRLNLKGAHGLYGSRAVSQTHRKSTVHEFRQRKQVSARYSRYSV